MHGFVNLLLLSGPSGGGKSTFASLLKTGALSDSIVARLPAQTHQWPIVDVTNRMRRHIAAEGEEAASSSFGNPTNLILHYDITTVYRYGLAGYENDPALRLLRLARTIHVVFICPDATRLHGQFVDRYADRQARKSISARAWNALVLNPARNLRCRLAGQPLNRERALYSDPLWIARCYDAWDAFITALAAVGAAQGIVRIAPCEAGERKPAFRIVSDPEWSVADTGEGKQI